MTQQLGTGVNPAALINQAQQFLTEAITAYRQPDAYSKLARFTVEQAAIDWGTVWGTAPDASTATVGPAVVPFPVLLRDVETLYRQSNVLQTLLVGFASTAYFSDIERAEIFGMPAGKAAFRNMAEFLRDALRIPLREANTPVKLTGYLSPAPRL